MRPIAESMRPIIMILGAVVAQITLFILMYFFWMNFGASIARWAASPMFLNGPFAAQVVLQLQNDLVWVGLVAWGVGILTTLIWLGIGALWSIADPRQVVRMRWIWLLLSLAGIAVSVIVTFGVTYGGLEALRDDLRPILPLFVGLPLFLICHWLAGSLWFTDPTLRTAVPLAHFVP